MLRSIALLLSLTLAAPALAQDAPAAQLPMGTAVKGEVTDAAPAIYHLTASSAGVLVVTCAAEGEDVGVVLFVTDEDGQVLEDGRSDRDIQGHPGKEVVAALLPEGGRYQVHVELVSSEEGKASFQVSAALAPMPAFASPNLDPDRRPSKATTLTAGKSVEDTIGGPDDPVDWFAVRAEQAGTITVLTRAGEGDLRLEAFVAGNYREAVATSDQDMNGIPGNESVNVTVRAGQTIYVRVSTFAGEKAEYKLTTAFIPD